jgi:hypothetical protein
LAGISGVTTRFRGPALVLLSLLAAAAAAPSRAEPPLRFGTIRIRSLNVFSPEEAERGWIYRFADSLRFTTRDSVIRRFLLFREGEPYNTTRIEESERNLRALPFIKNASITVYPPRNGAVDVEVITQDAWTTEPGINIGGKGGTTTWGIDLKEKDFLGTGRQIALAYDKGSERTVRLAEYRDPYLLGNYWNGLLRYADNSDGSEQTIQIVRPFYSFVTPWATDIVLDNLRQNERIYEDGRAISVFRQKHREALLDYGRAIVASDQEAQRLTAGFHLIHDRFAPEGVALQPILPDERDFRYLFVRFEMDQNDFLKLNYVNRDIRFEDFDLGFNFAVEAAVSPELLGAPSTTEFLRLATARGWRFRRSFLQTQLAYETRIEGGSFRHQVLSASAFFAYRFDTRLIQTFVSRMQVDRGWRLDRDLQFFADGDNGLRGYPLHAYAGNRRILWNLEHRVFWGREYLQLASPGAVVFADIGGAVPDGRPFRGSDIKSDVGIGLRASISRAASNSVVRIDLAYPLNRDPFGRRRPIVSFSSGQVF